MSRASIVSQIAHQTCLNEPPKKFDRWWDELEADFHSQSERFDLALGDQLRVQGTAAGDHLLRAFTASVLGATVVPFGFNPLKLRQLAGDRDFYAPFAEGGDPHAFFSAPQRGVAIETSEARLPRFRPTDGICEDVYFDSPFVPVNPAERRAYQRHRANRRAHARYWRHVRGPRPTIVAIHGFNVDLYLINEWFFALPRLFHMGCDVLLVTLPFHGPRQTLFSPFSGHGFFAGGIRRLNEAIAHSVHDTRLLLRWVAEERGAPQVGVTGVSLGGFVTALVATLEPELAFAMPNVPVVSIVDLAMEWEPVGSLIRSALRLSGWSLTEARHLVAAASPLSYAPAIPYERRFIIGGVGDRMAPPKHSRLLWDHWERCRLHWFPGGHVVHIDRAGYLRQIGRFLRDLDFLPQHRGRSSAV